MENAISFAILARIGIEREIREALLKVADVDVTQPSMIRIAVTDRCNYRCAYCNHWKQDRYKRELSLVQWRQVFKNLQAVSAKSIIQFTGGEPFLRRDFLEIAGCAEEAGFYWGVITNGYCLTEKVCEAICRLSPVNIDVSIDGACETIHDQARGVPGSFAAVTRGVKELCAARRKSNKNFKIRIKTTVHKLNISSLTDVASLAAELGADSIDFSPIRHEDDSSRKWLLPDDGQLNELERSIDALCGLKKAGIPIETSERKLRLFSNHFGDKVVRHGTVKCKAPLRDLFIDPSGETRFCWAYGSLGNIVNSSAEEVWSSHSSRLRRHEAMTCSKAGSSYCATSCLSHRKFSDNVKRALLHAEF